MRQLFILFLTVTLHAQNFSISREAGSFNGSIGQVFSSADSSAIHEFIPSAMHKNYRGLEIAIQNWYEDYRKYSFFINFGFEKSKIGFFAKQEINDGIELRDKPSELPDGVTDAVQSVFAFSYAFQIYDQLAFGLNYKFIQEQMFIYTARIRAYDFSLSYKSNNYHFFISLIDCFSSQQDSPLDEPLRESYVLGVNYHWQEFKFYCEYHQLNQDYFISSKVETVLLKQLQFILAYEINSPFGLSCGIRVPYQSISLGYAVRNNDILDWQQQFQFSWRF